MTLEEFLAELKPGESLNCRRSIRNPTPVLIWTVEVFLPGEKAKVIRTYKVGEPGLVEMLNGLLTEARKQSKLFRADPYGRKTER